MDRNAKVGFALVPLLLIAAAAWWQFGALPGLPEATDDGEVAAAGAARDRQADAGGTSSESHREQVEPGAETPTAKTETGSLLVQVIYGDDDSPAAHIGIRVRESRREGPLPQWHHTETDAKGEVRLSGFRPGKVIVWTDRQENYEE